MNVLKKAMLYDKGQTVASKKVKNSAPKCNEPKRSLCQTEGGKVQRLIERAQNAKAPTKGRRRRTQWQLCSWEINHGNG